jgi:hypothetical protein
MGFDLTTVVIGQNLILMKNTAMLIAQRCHEVI